MPLVYDKLFKMFKQQGISTYQIRKQRIISKPILQRLRKNGIVRTQAISDLCEKLNCQPGDIMEYIPDKKEQEEN